MADTKITELVAGTLSSDDLLTFVDDPSGTPVNKKIAYSTFEAAISITESQISDLGTYATSAYVDSAVAGLYDHKGAYDASTNSPDLDTSPSGVLKGDAYTVSAAGTFFTAAVDAGDVLIADQDSPTHETHWTIVNRNIDETAFATASHTHATADITSGTFADARIAESNVTQHEAALSIVASQVTSGTLPHERGGLEFDVSAVAKGDVIAGSGTGTLALVAASGASDGDVLTVQADGSVAFETGGGGGGGDTLPVSDTTGIAKGSADATKIVRLEVDGLTTATTRVLTVQDSDGTIELTGHTHATTDVTSGTFADARIAESNVTQHEAALTITESQVSDLGSYLTDITGEALSTLSDVTITTISSGELLTWNGSAWVNETLAEAGIAAASHNHAASDITSGTLTHERGGIEADISAVAIGDILAGTGSGTIGIVAASGASDGDVLTVQADGSVAFETGGGGGSVAMDDLTDADMTTTSPSQYDLLTFDGTDWVPLVVGVPSLDDVVKWDGSAWSVGSAPAGSVAMDDLTDADMTTTTPSSYDLMTFDGTDWVPLVVGTPSTDDVVKWDGSAWSVGAAPGSLPVTDTTTLAKDPSDATKLVRLDAGFVPTATTAAITPLCSDSSTDTTIFVRKNIVGGAIPGVGYDGPSGYATGSFYFSSVANVVYFCSDVTNNAAVWNRVQMAAGLGTITDGATVTVDADDESTQKVTLGGNRTIAFDNFVTGQRVCLRLTQDGTGSRTVTWPSSGVTINWSGGSAPTLTTTASKADWIVLICTDDSSGAEIYDAAVAMANV